jgi:hypothetical protein
MRVPYLSNKLCPYVGSRRSLVNHTQSHVRRLVTVSTLPGYSYHVTEPFREGNVLWTEFPNLRPCSTTPAPRTRPKPDLTYAFPVTDCSLDKLRGFERDVLSTAFTIQTLSTLTQRGTICAPTAGLRNWPKPTRRPLETKDLACFPWAVVEVKKHVRTKDVTPIERCYCQAANASAAALDIRAQLFNKVSGDAVSPLPPVIAFTCIGHIVKVWLTYLDTSDADRTAHVQVSSLRPLKCMCILTLIADGMHMEDLYAADMGRSNVEKNHNEHAHVGISTSEATNLGLRAPSLDDALCTSCTRTSNTRC